MRLRLPDGSAAGGHRRLQPTFPVWVQRIRQSRLAQGTASALVLATLLHLRYGYAVGDRDHHVLSPRGLQWVHPDWFTNDWTIANAPQPHWFFDIVTWAGESTHTLIFLYLAYWLGAMAAFGAATTILSHTWAPRFPWLATAFVTVGSAITPIDNLGSGSLWYATPLPNILGGCLLLLTTTGLLTNRHRLAAFAGTATALVHVQHGTVTTVLFVLMGLWVFKRTRRIDWNLVGGAGGSLAFTVLALQLRPIAGHISDFTEACHVIIPYHCEANTWTKSYILGGTAVVFLGLLVFFYLARSERYRWWIVVALPAFGLLSGVAADKLDIPFFGTLAQGLNIPRLMLVVLPLSLWGVLVPLAAELTPRMRWLLVGTVMVLGMFALRLGWAVDLSATLRSSVLILGFAGCIVLASVAVTVPGITRAPEPLRALSVAGLTFFILASMVVGHTIKPRPFDIRMYPQGNIAAWGDRVRAVVPVGEEILIPPTGVEFRMITKRAVVVDCKYGPYGGAAWAEYKARIEAVGGFGQCLGTLGAPTFGDLSGADLAGVARRYGAHYILVESRVKPLSRNVIESRVAVPDSAEDDESQLIPAPDGGQLRDLGWSVVLGPGKEMPFFLLKAPGV